MTNDEFRIHVVSGNDLDRNQPHADDPAGGARLLKYAIFYLVVAAILVIANRGTKNSTSAANLSQPLSNLHLDLSVARNLGPNRLASNASRGGMYVVRFRLMNQGNEPVLYPVFPNTNRPMGHVVCRIAPGSDWKLLSRPDLSPSQPAELHANDDIVWVEMPPGGWADGEYADTGAPVGEHAYEIDVRFAVDGKVSPLFSRPYLTSAN